MVGATLSVAVLGLFAMHAGETGEAASFRLPYLVGGAGELIGAALAFMFVSADALKKRRSERTKQNAPQFAGRFFVHWMPVTP